MLQFPIARFVASAAVACAICAIVTLPVSIEAQMEVVAYHDFSSMKTWPLGKMQVKGAMGQSGSLAIAELPEGFRQTPHHHAQEQIVLGIGGMTEMSIDGNAHQLGVHGAVVTPRNVQHGNANAGAGTATFIEFQSVLRTDWFPPHQKFVPPVAAAPAPIQMAPNQNVYLDFGSSDGWRTEANGARSKTLNGETLRITVWDLSSAKASVTLNPQHARPEQFVYVLEGAVEIHVDSSPRAAATHTLAVISPSAKDVRLGSVGKGRTLVAVFEATAR